MTQAHTDLIKVTRLCALCHQPMHLWQDTSGSGWIHDSAAAEYTCFRDQRADYEAGRGE